MGTVFLIQIGGAKNCSGSTMKPPGWGSILLLMSKVSVTNHDHRQVVKLAAGGHGVDDGA